MLKDIVQILLPPSIIIISNFSLVGSIAHKICCCTSRLYREIFNLISTGKNKNRANHVTYMYFNQMIHHSASREFRVDTCHCQDGSAVE